MYVVKADGLYCFSFLVLSGSCYMNVGYIIVGQKSVECEFDVWVLVFFGGQKSNFG